MTLEGESNTTVITCTISWSRPILETLEMMLDHNRHSWGASRTYGCETLIKVGNSHCKQEQLLYFFYNFDETISTSEILTFALQLQSIMISDLLDIVREQWFVHINRVKRSFRSVNVHATKANFGTFTRIPVRQHPTPIAIQIFLTSYITVVGSDLMLRSWNKE